MSAAAVAERQAEAVREMHGVPWLHPRANAFLQFRNDLIGDPLINVFQTHSPSLLDFGVQLLLDPASRRAGGWQAQGGSEQDGRRVRARDPTQKTRKKNDGETCGYRMPITPAEFGCLPEQLPANRCGAVATGKRGD